MRPIFALNQSSNRHLSPSFAVKSIMQYTFPSFTIIVSSLPYIMIIRDKTYHTRPSFAVKCDQINLKPVSDMEFLKMKMKISLLEEQVRNAQRVAEEQKEDATFVLVLHGEKIGVPLEIKNYSDVNSLVSQCKLMMGLNETDELKVCTKHHKHDDQLVTVMPHDVLKPGKIYYAKRMMCFAALMVRHLNQEHFRQSVGKLAREHGFGGGIERNSSDITSYRLHLYSPNKTQLQQFLEVTLPKVANVHSKWSIVCAEEQRERAMFFPFQLHAKPNEEEYSTGRKCMNTIQKAECMMKTMKHNNGTYQTNTNGTYQTNTNGTYQTNTNGRCH
eukprot:193063_1